MLVAVVALAVVVLDQFTKTLAMAYLGPYGGAGPVSIVPGVLSLVYVENTGAAFGLFQGRNPVLALVALAIVLLLAVWFRAVAAATPWGGIALGLQIGGALGNVADRLRHGFVVDFIDLSFWPTFNLADSAITVGVVVLLIVLMRSTESARERGAQRTWSDLEEGDAER